MNSAYLLVPPGRGSPGHRSWRHQSLVPLVAPVCLCTRWIAVPPGQGSSRSHKGQQDWAKGIYYPRGSGDQLSTWQLPAGELWRWKQNKGVRVLEYSWTKGIREHSQARPLREDGYPAFIASQPHPSLSSSGSLIKDPPQYWQACHPGLIPPILHLPPGLCAFIPHPEVLSGVKNVIGRVDKTPCTGTCVPLPSSPLPI